MAHGGHHSHHHHHHHYHHYGSSSRRSGGDDGLALAALGLGCVIVFLALLAGIGNSIGGKKPLEGNYETYESYLIDTEGYFSSQNELISGLQYLHEHTNVQVVVMASRDSWSDRKAVEQYHSMFSDEAHVLIIVPTSWFTSTEYYAIGDLADPIIGDHEIDYLLDRIDGSRKGTKWNQCLKEFTDKLLSE